MKLIVFISMAVIVAEVAYLLAVIRWNFRKPRMVPLTERNVWLVMLGLVTVEYPPHRAKYYIFSFALAILLMVAL
ncbi:MAG: hypothetical protein FOGNACKC_00730 [Anaerolineae bacterium]|nr:hypothetical protein [Anaerolineae bacterium]